MNPFNLGLRNLLGVLLPGALLVLVILACFAALVPDARPMIGQALTEKAALVIAALFLVSYVAGSTVRLYAADTVDRISARLVRVEKDPYEHDEGSVQLQLEKLLSDVSNPFVQCPPARDFARWAWKHDAFPYPVWEWMKFRLYHPPEMLAFYEPYKECFATGDRRGKEFFNYCKTVIFSAYDGKRHALAEEVQAAEANVRFFAGTFWAVTLSFVALVATAFLLVLDKPQTRLVLSPLIASAVLTGLIGFAIIAGGRFRLLRLKEVDTVFDAFYLVHRHAMQCPTCSRPRESALYDARRLLLEDTFAAGMSLDRLFSLMRFRSRDNPALSSLYFAGANRDHPYFINTDRFAAGFSVLPEDETKSTIPKRHPHQNEVVIVLEGEMLVEVMARGRWQEAELTEGEVKVIQAGECHRIRSKNKAHAAFLFVKTNPALEPREQICPEREEE